ncbi:SDR family NAD(P)-dependent oxidoreductase [Pseudonocardia eucalypti]|uniref:SDR family NAD(P)-dependent oxidoreductase n=1 Tax=Pseudonocardia eucalypti TaxID=648755 RepID=A0ABP9PGX3_9PSEU|nr:NAD(P)-dependent dehydrogenase (short-subunit alcohol dehydrogenase family) [Pseudonocardia eucalypti]
MAVPDVSGRSLADLLSLSGRRALVTGGAKGIGLACARRLAEAGARVAVGDLDKAEAQQAAATLDGDAIGLALDVRDTASVDAAVEQVRTELGGLDILVNNAGVFPIMPVLETTDEQWEKVLGTNVDGGFRCARAAGRAFAEAGTGGVIVNLASIQSFRATAPGLTAYCTSKGAVLGLTQSLALELGALGVRVVGVAPTVVDTPGLALNKPVYEAAGLSDVIAAFSAQLPLGRAAVPDDVARVVLFAVSDLAVLVSGTTLVVDAGHLTL